MQTFTEILLRLSDRHGVGHVFPDFLEMAVCALSLGAKEEHYHKIISKYQPNEVQMMASAFASLVEEMDNDGSGLRDCLGDFFMEHLSFGRNGQFFTPQNICDMMAIITGTSGEGQRVADCACGSGRTLMAAAKISRMNSFYGADIDRTCCLMAVINLCLNGMVGEVAWMDSLCNRFYGGWKIGIHPVKPVPFVREITAAESYMYLQLPEPEPKAEKLHLPELAKVETVQTSLWDEWTF